MFQPLERCSKLESLRNTNDKFGQFSLLRTHSLNNNVMVYTLHTHIHTHARMHTCMPTDEYILGFRNIDAGHFYKAFMVSW